MGRTVRSLAALLSCLLAISPLAIQTNAFWLTDGSLFQQPVELIGPQLAETRPPTQQTSSSSSPTISSIELQPASRSQEASSTTESWLQLATETTKTELVVKSPKTTQHTGITQEPTVANRSFVNINSQEVAVCQCDSGWVQNQTNVWLNKWLGSPQFANYMRSLGPLGSSSPRGNTLNGGQNANQRGGSSLAWNKPGARRSERNSQQANRVASSGTHHNHRGAAAASSSASQAARPAHNGQQRAAVQQQQALAPTVKVVQGERGPKGDQGERGPSGLISVKDRDALFELPASSTPGPRMVFVESEQLLVLETSPGPSWRPIPLLAPLHDFRKTIAKFNLNSAEERRRLLAAANSDGRRPLVLGQDGQPQVVPTTMAIKNKVAVPAAPDSSLAAATEQLFERAVVKSNSILGALDSTSGRATRKGPLDIVDATDEEEEEEEEEEDDDEDDEEEDGDDLNMENEDEDDDDDEGEEDGHEANQIGADERARPSGGGKGARGLIDFPIAGNRMPEASKLVTSSKRARSRSTAGGSEMVAASDSSETDQEEETPVTGNVMRLRLVALNEPFSGNQHGLRGANFECKRNAARAGVKGAFRALLATNYQNLNEIVRYNSHVPKYPIVNLRGDTLASSWHDLLRAPARSINPLSRIQSFDGRHVASDPNWPNKLVWLGTGSKSGHRDSSSHNCDGWHSDSLNKLGFATPLHSPKAHLHSHRQHHAAAMKRSQQRRYAGDEPGNSLVISRNSANASSSMVFDVIEKYPCRMPLIVLCIETVAQAD